MDGFGVCVTLHLVGKKGNRIPPVTNQSQQGGSSLCVDVNTPTRSLTADCARLSGLLLKNALVVTRGPQAPPNHRNNHCGIRRFTRNPSECRQPQRHPAERQSAFISRANHRVAENYPPSMHNGIERLLDHRGRQRRNRRTQCVANVSLTPR